MKKLATILVVVLVIAASGACGANGEGEQDSAAGGTPEVSRPSPAAESTPLGKPDVVLKVKTPSGKRFVPEELKAPAGAVVKIVYTNLSDLPHQFKIFAGTHTAAPVLGATRAGDEAKPRSTIFQLPEEPGRFFYFCPILGHGFVMRGFLIAK